MKFLAIFWEIYEAKEAKQTSPHSIDDKIYHYDTSLVVKYRMEALIIASFSWVDSLNYWEQAMV